MADPELSYQQRINRFQEDRGKISRKLQFVPWLRLLLFIAIAVSVYFLIKTGEFVFIGAAGASLAVFILAGLYDFRLKQKINALDTGIEINKREIKAIHGDYSVFDPGNEFINEEHPYTNDLDIFGAGSLFQYVNRTSTIYGKRRLGYYFNNAYLFRDEMIPRQQSIRELSGMLDFRQRLQAIFFENKTTDNDLAAIMDWLDAEGPSEETPVPGKYAGKKRLLRIALFLGPIITISGILLAIAGIVKAQVPVFLVTLQLMIVLAFGRRTLKVHQKISSQFKIMQKYAQALLIIENISFETELLKSLQAGLSYDNRESPSQVITRFSQLLNWMDSNLNMLASVFLNGLFMFNLHLLLAIDDWRLKYRNLIPEWFDILAEFDALSGLAACSFNNPGFIFPEAGSGEFILIAKNIGHPLIPQESCVKNDIEIRGWKQFCIITGANMAGKSTFLRTIGTNYILAMMGATVCADKFIFTPVEIHSSIRTNDSLAKGESYFYKELKRLKEIILELESGLIKLILLDEILKGTNSSDKQSGSIALIKQLMNYRVVGMFATHDVAISRLIDIYPENIRNLCFEISIENDRMAIDYKLRPGVCQNLNASFLMKKMGIVLE